MVGERDSFCLCSNRSWFVLKQFVRKKVKTIIIYDLVLRKKKNKEREQNKWHDWNQAKVFASVVNDDDDGDDLNNNQSEVSS